MPKNPRFCGMAMAVHESPDMTKQLWPVRKRLRRDSSPPTPPNTTPTTATGGTGVPFSKWRQNAAPVESAGPAAGGVNDAARDDDGKRVRVVLTRVKARGRARRRRLLSQITASPACPIQQYPHEWHTTAAGQTQVRAVGKVAALDPWVVPIPVAGASLWHSGQNSGIVDDPLWIVQRLPPPLELPASPVNAILEADLRVLFDQLVRRGELVFRFCTGSGPGSEHIECCDVLTAWVFRLLKEGAGDKVWQEQIERLVYKVLFEYIMKLHFGGSCGNAGRTASPLSGGELMNVHGQMPEELLFDMLIWLKGVAVGPLEPRSLGTLQDQGWRKWQNVNISSHRGLPPGGPNCSNLYECPGEDNFMSWRKMVLSSREALFVKTKDVLPTAEFPYRLKKRRRIHQYLSGTSRPTVPIYPDNVGSYSVEQGESANSLVSIHRMPIQSRRRLPRLLALLKLSDCHRKRVPIGAAFQADVPPWKGPCSGEDSSDSRWFGTRVWPIECDLQEANQEPIGKGRVDSCVCPFPSSVSCVRYHVRVGRLKLRRNLGKAFNSLGLNDMGEEVSDSWTVDEERIFSALVKLNPLSEDKSFWEPALKLLGSKSRQKIVSYYFNVFVPRRMGIQTRFLSGDADSDDDEVNVDGYEDSYPRAPCKWYHPFSDLFINNHYRVDDVSSLHKDEILCFS